MKRINTIIESNTQPRGNNTLWIKPKEGGGKELKLGSESIIASSDTLLLDKLDSNEVVKLFQTDSTYRIQLPDYFTDYKIDIGSMLNTLKTIRVRVYNQEHYFKLDYTNLSSRYLPLGKTFRYSILSYTNPLSWTIRVISITIQYNKANNNYMLTLNSHCLGNNA